MKFPSNIIIENKSAKNKAIPDFFREISIANIGSMPSKNLKIQIVLDGKIVDSEVLSIENYEKTHKGNSEIIITMGRLAKNAEVNLKIWLIKGANNLSLQAIDDQGSFKIGKIEELQKRYYVEILSSILVFLLLSVIVYQWVFIPKNEVIRSRDSEIKKIQEDYGLVLSERDKLQSLLENTMDEPKADPLSELKAFVAKREPH